MTTSNQVVIDTNILVALVDRLDKWHASAEALREAFKANNAGLVYFDPVINEAFSVLARRAQEQRRSRQEVSGLLDTLTHLVPKEAITWVSSETQGLYEQVVALVRDTSGELNFHDALIALNCRLCGIKVIASFDHDFDQVEWLSRVETPEEVVAAFEQVSPPQNP
jgi:Predicted nucleic acid-binding protein, contains PIN domain